VNGTKVTASYDNGSNISVVNSELLKQIKSTLFHSEQFFRTISGVHHSTDSALLLVKINNTEHEIICRVVKNDNFLYDLLLGLDAIKTFGLIQDENLQIWQQINATQIKPVPMESDPAAPHVNVITQDEIFSKLTHLEVENQNKMMELIYEHLHIFAAHKYDIGKISNHEATIKLIEKKYAAKKPYRCPLAKELEIEDQVAQLLRHNIIEESTSPFAAPVTTFQERGRMHAFMYGLSRAEPESNSRTTTLSTH